MQVPTDYNPDGSDTTKDNARLVVVLSKHNATNNPKIFYLYRSGGSVQSSYINATGTSTNQSSPSQYNHTISLDGATSNKIINSVIVYVEFTTASSATSEKIYIPDAYVELY